MLTYDQLTEKQQKRFDRILQLAEEMIFEQGFHKLSLMELTNKLKISRSTIYENFGSKEGLVEKVVERFGQRLDEGLHSVLNNKSLNTKEKFIRVAQTQGQILNGRSDNKLFRDLRIHLPDLYKHFLNGRKKREEFGYKVLIDQGIKEGLFDENIPADFLLQLYLKMGQMVCDTDILEHTSLSKENAMETIIKIFLKGAKKI